MTPDLASSRRSPRTSIARSGGYWLPERWRRHAGRAALAPPRGRCGARPSPPPANEMRGRCWRSRQRGVSSARDGARLSPWRPPAPPPPRVLPDGARAPSRDRRAESLSAALPNDAAPTVPPRFRVSRSSPGMTRGEIKCDKHPLRGPLVPGSRSRATGMTSVGEARPRPTLGGHPGRRRSRSAGGYSFPERPKQHSAPVFRPPAPPPPFVINSYR